MMDAGVFDLVAAILAVCVIAGVAATLLRQPLLVGLLAAGVAVGPQALGLVSHRDEIELLGEIGISLLLFVVGLKLDPRIVRRLGPVVLAAGSVQVVLTAAGALAIARSFGVDWVPALYLAAAMAFSSTVIVVKLLTDRRELEDLHGRISLGILIVQDLFVVLLMILLAAIQPGEGRHLGLQFLLVAVRGLTLVAAVVVLTRFVVPAATHLLARSGELLVIASVAWAVALAAVAEGLGFSTEVGAFIAGVSLASSPYREAISGRLSTLRDFLLVFFFIDLGASLELGGLADLGLVAALSVFVLVVKPLIVAVVSTLLGFRARVGTRSGLTLAQISEFSLILAALGVGLGHIDPRTVGVVTGVALVTITASTYLTAGADRLLPALCRPVRRLERDLDRGGHLEPAAGHTPSVIVVGLGRLGRTVLDELRRRGDDVLAVDFDPRSVKSGDEGIPVIYGDAEDPELPHALPLSGARWVVSTLRDVHANASLIAALRHDGYRGRIAVSADEPMDVATLERAGADLVVRPFHVAAEPFVSLLHTD